MYFMKTADDVERIVMQAAADRYFELLAKLDQSRANMIANSVSRLFKGK